MLQQKGATGEQLASMVLEIVNNPEKREAMVNCLNEWHHSDAAELIAERMIAFMRVRHEGKSGVSQPISRNENVVKGSNLGASGRLHPSEPTHPLRCSL